MMTTKRILLAVLCALLVLVIIMTGIVISRVTRLLGSSTTTRPTDSPTNGPSTAPTDITEGPTRPTVPTESLGPTEPGHEHEYVLTERVDPGCNSYGYSIYVCSCGKYDYPLDEQVDPLGHNFGYGKVIDPTCENPGYTEFECTRCGEIEKRNETEPTGHQFDEGTEIPASCTEDAYTEYKCTADGCDEVKQENIQAGTATGHTFGEWTENENGEMQRICETCGEVEIYTGTDLPVDPDDPTDPTEPELPAITGQQSTQETDAAGSAYTLYLITVGTSENPGAFTYTIYDYQNNAAIEFSYDAENGLAVSFTDASGNLQSYTLQKESDASLTIDASGSTAGG